MSELVSDHEDQIPFNVTNVTVNSSALMVAGMRASLKQSRPKHEFSIRIRSWKLSLVLQAVVPHVLKGFPNAPACTS